MTEENPTREFTLKLDNLPEDVLTKATPALLLTL